MPKANFLSLDHPRLLAVVTAVIACFSMVLWAPGASAAAGCDTVTPSIGQTISCTSTGTESITIPVGANRVLVGVVGGGGQGGAAQNSSPAGGDGGDGAQILAEFELPTGETTLDIKVGAGGCCAGGGGIGGDFSRIVGQSSGTLLALAGGGGGGGEGNPTATGGSGALLGTAAGGSGGPGGLAGGGTGGFDGMGGFGGSGLTLGVNGDTYLGGGDGGYGGATRGGAGGNGYGGGGGGGSSGSSSHAGGGAGGSYVDATYLIGSATFAAATFGGAGGAGAPANSGTQGQAGNAGLIVLTFILYVPPSDSSAANGELRTVTIRFALPTNVTCSFDTDAASIGAWMQLPDAQDCTMTKQSADTQPTLLGWATNPDFPVDIAQRQVDNGWGAYETFGDNGHLTSVFIPAGGYTAVTGDTNLYPIWSE